MARESERHVGHAMAGEQPTGSSRQEKRHEARAKRAQGERTWLLRAHAVWVAEQGC